MNVLMLCDRGAAVRTFVLRGPMEVGSAESCDIVVRDPSIRARHALLVPRGSAVRVVPLGHEPEAEPEPETKLELGVGLCLGQHRLVRVPWVPDRQAPRDGATEPIGVRFRRAPLSLVVGTGSDARVIRLGNKPLTVGTGPGCEIRLSDRAVSAQHVRFVVANDGGAWVQDLESRNGTHVDGVLIQRARITAGSKIRVGRSNIALVCRDRSDASRPVAASEEMRDVFTQAERFAKISWPALILGESGSGKEVVARTLHERGPRSGSPWVAVNAGGLPPTLIESELFGHERGAFTGARQEHRGVFEQAHGGTLFLDEIGEVPLEMQARLLRVLETWRVRRVGSEETRRVDVRLVCATHRNLANEVRAGKFRTDLYYRIAQLTLHIPPLRERPEDILALSERFVAEASRQLGPRQLAPNAMRVLRDHPWPGNVRELRNVIRSAAANTVCATISADQVREAIEATASNLRERAAHWERILEQHDHNISAAARALGIPRSTLRDRVRRSRPRA